jgi:transcriptional regulator NrdR family protein
MIEAIDGKANLVIKRNGTLEPYDPNKLFKVLLWACNDNETLANSILGAIDLRRGYLTGAAGHGHAGDGRPAGAGGDE